MCNVQRSQRYFHPLTERYLGRAKPHQYCAVQCHSSSFQLPKLHVVTVCVGLVRTHLLDAVNTWMRVSSRYPKYSYFDLNTKLRAVSPNLGLWVRNTPTAKAKERDVLSRTCGLLLLSSSVPTHYRPQCHPDETRQACTSHPFSHSSSFNQRSLKVGSKIVVIWKEFAKSTIYESHICSLFKINC